MIKKEIMMRKQTFIVLTKYLIIFYRKDKERNDDGGYGTNN